MRKLSRKKSHRELIIRNLLTSLILYESIETSLAKAKETKIWCDRLFTRAKTKNIEAHRYLASILMDKNAIKKALDELVPRFADRKSGFTTLYKTGNRLGDNAPKARIELIEKKVFVKNIVKKNSKDKESDDKTK